jgi:hypothetical protein
MKPRATDEAANPAFDTGKLGCSSFTALKPAGDAPKPAFDTGKIGGSGSVLLAQPKVSGDAANPTFGFRGAAGAGSTLQGGARGAKPTGFALPNGEGFAFPGAWGASTGAS